MSEQRQAGCFRCTIDSHKLANLDLEPGLWCSDNLGIAVVEYWERHPGKPDDSPPDNERGGWTVWALNKADECFTRWAEKLKGGA